MFSISLEQREKFLKHGLIIVPYVLLAFVIFKNQQENKIQLEKVNKNIVEIKHENTVLKSEITGLQKENKTLTEQVESQRREALSKSSEFSKNTTTERFDNQTGKLIERTRSNYSSKTKENKNTQSSDTKKSTEIKKVEKETKRKEEQNINKNTEKNQTENKKTTFERKKFGVNVGVLYDFSEIGPAVSYSVIPLTSEVSLDIGIAKTKTVLIGVQVSATVIPSIGVGAGVYTPVNEIKLVPGVSLQYRF